MVAIQPLYLGCFTDSKDCDYITPAPTLVLLLEGVETIKWEKNEVTPDGPMLLLIPGEVSLSLKNLSNRKNWAAVFRADWVRHSTSTGLLEMKSEDHWFDINWYRKLDSAQAMSLEQRCRALRSVFEGSGPIANIHLSLGLYGLISELFVGLVKESSTSPAAKLKKHIDSDINFNFSIEELSLRCRYSPDHLRLLFNESYGITPLRYRNRRRMQRVMELINDTDLSLKEIAARTGFSYPSHMSAMFHREYGMSPSSARSF